MSVHFLFLCKAPASQDEKAKIREAETEKNQKKARDIAEQLASQGVFLKILKVIKMESWPILNLRHDGSVAPYLHVVGYKSSVKMPMAWFSCFIRMEREYLENLLSGVWEVLGAFQLPVLSHVGRSSSHSKWEGENFGIKPWAPHNITVW